MADVFRQVPDWFPAENSGGGVAVGSLAGDGNQDLVVFMIDNPVGRNRGLFRVGRRLSDAGEVTGGWTPWTDVPDWFSFENAGGNIALADLDGNGRQDLVVAMVDNPVGQNRGLFRIGRSLDAAGQVTGGWTPWIDVPDWFSFENSGIAVAVTPPDGQGRRDLVVVMVDNPDGKNRGLYRIGRDLDADGNVSSWSAWFDVPDWFSFENAACGAAVADLTGDGTNDLVVFNLDNAVGQNQAFYKIGRGLGDGQIPDDRWGSWLGVPNWFAFENSGGGVAVATIGGSRRLVAFMVDNPPGPNAGLYEVLHLDHDPAREGTWEVMSFFSGVLAVHTALLPKGKVLFFAGSGSSATRFRSPLFGSEPDGVFTSVVWDPPGNSFTHPRTLRTADHRPFDFFCGGDAFLADGRLLSAGGTVDYGPFRGRKDAAIFDFRTGQWSFAGTMAQGRWYPTLITLGDGRVLAATGLGEHDGDAPKRTVEIYSPGTDTWQTKHFAGGFPGLPLYAHLFLLADGRVFFSGGRMDDGLVVDPCLVDLAHEPMTTAAVKNLGDPFKRNQSASVLLPPAQDQRVMVIGGGPAGKQDKTDATDAVSVVDLSGHDPVYHPAAPLGLPRLHLNAVLLPDRTVFVGGGSLKQEDTPLARLQGEIYDPAGDTWTLTAAAEVPRLYHSTAALLPDGRVVAAGGNPEGGHSVTWLPPDEEEELRVEVFSPPYLFKGPRPVVGHVTEEWTYGSTVTVPTPQAASIAFASLLKNCVTTHSFDNGQRLVDLPITGRDGDSLDLAVTGNPNVAPPGWYMLFLVDHAGVPSVATWICLS